MAFTFAALVSLAMSAGFPAGDVARTAAAIALAESGGNPSAVGDGGASIGLWQINIPSHPKADPARLTEPDYNAQIAVETWRAAKGFAPWSVYRSGAYKKYLPTSSNGGPVSLPSPVRYAPALLACAIFVAVVKGIRK